MGLVILWEGHCSGTPSTWSLGLDQLCLLKDPEQQILPFSSLSPYRKRGLMLFVSVLKPAEMYKWKTALWEWRIISSTCYFWCPTGEEPLSFCRHGVRVIRVEVLSNGLIKCYWKRRNASPFQAFQHFILHLTSLNVSDVSSFFGSFLSLKGTVTYYFWVRHFIC